MDLLHEGWRFIFQAFSPNQLSPTERKGRDKGEEYHNYTFVALTTLPTSYQAQSFCDLTLVLEALILSSPSLMQGLFIIEESKDPFCQSESPTRMITSLQQLDIGRQYKTEKRIPIRRISINELDIAGRIRIPLSLGGDSEQFTLRGIFRPSTAIVAIENFSSKRLSNGIALFELSSPSAASIHEAQHKSKSVFSSSSSSSTTSAADIAWKHGGAYITVFRLEDITLGIWYLVAHLSDIVKLYRLSAEETYICYKKQQQGATEVRRHHTASSSSSYDKENKNICNNSRIKTNNNNGNATNSPLKTTQSVALMKELKQELAHGSKTDRRKHKFKSFSTVSTEAETKQLLTKRTQRPNQHPVDVEQEERKEREKNEKAWRLKKENDRLLSRLLAPASPTTSPTSSSRARSRGHSKRRQSIAGTAFRSKSDVKAREPLFQSSLDLIATSFSTSDNNSMLLSPPAGPTSFSLSLASMSPSVNSPFLVKAGSLTASSDSNSSSIAYYASYTTPPSSPPPTPFSPGGSSSSSIPSSSSYFSAPPLQPLKEQHASLIEQPVTSTSGPAPPPPPPVAPPPPPPPFVQKSTAKNNSSSSSPNKRSASSSEADQQDQQQASRKKMRPLHWSVIPKNKIEQTVWNAAAVEDAPPIKVNVSELESLFSISPTVQRRKSIAATPSSKSSTSSSAGMLLPLQRVNNIAILLSQFKTTQDKIQEAIWQMDEDMLCIDRVKALKYIAPKEEEIELLMGYAHPQQDSTDDDKLGPAERFLLKLMEIPRLNERLDTFLWKKQYSTLVQDVQRDTETVLSACIQVKTNQKFPQLLKTILALGSVLNRDNHLSSSHGFRMESLTKLTETRGKHKDVTLLHYLKKEIENQMPSLLNFHEELQSIEAASKVSIENITAELKQMKIELSRVHQQIVLCQKHHSDAETKDRYVAVMMPFYNEAKAEIEALEEVVLKMRQEWTSLATFFGEDASKCLSHVFFACLHNFVRCFVSIDTRFLVSVMPSSSSEG
ncbi:WH2 domain-containing protein [Balamuthia mandrillaris]